MTARSRIAIVLLLLATAFGFPRSAGAYSVLTHEQLIDLTWDSAIVPLLLSRYPTLTPAEIERARAYAYGGCVIQDIGYYPFTPPPATLASADVAAAEDSARHPEASNSVPPKSGAAQLIPRRSVDPNHPLPNRDLDTGNPVQPAGYRLTDDTYATLLHRLVQNPTVAIPPGIKENILAYYADLSLPFATKKIPAAWTQLQADLTVMRSMPTTTAPIPFTTYDHGETDVDTTPPAQTPGS